ncbi:helix-turn-helix transcriptional regulator [Tahibacter harae]|uniref:Helix-turn-helix domain-containing protein n=1 Tax=Tahibacter harae TaxID=2963937 RepID=A0ABT1QQX6_9GAMM|nr:helix-turn-helix domain-containing protein [Tahibacter harae]MCQ4164700.1 helix-turn-helix domain-containing protein [Tahibacter harae]
MTKSEVWEMPPSGLLPPKKAAVYLAVSVRALEEWRRKGAGPEFIRAGRGIRYRLADLDAWIAQQKKLAQIRAA